MWKVYFFPKGFTAEQKTGRSQNEVLLCMLKRKNMEQNIVWEIEYARLQDTFGLGILWMVERRRQPQNTCRHGLLT